MSQMTTNYLNPVTGWFEQVHGHNGRIHVIKALWREIN